MRPIWITVEDGDVFEGHQLHWANCFFSNATRPAIESFLNTPGAVDSELTYTPEAECLKYTIREMTDEEVDQYPGLREFCEGLEF